MIIIHFIATGAIAKMYILVEGEADFLCGLH